MTPEKFTVRSLLVLAAMLFIAILTQGTSYVNFFLIDYNVSDSANESNQLQVISCETVNVNRVEFLTSKPNSLETSLHKLLSVKTPKVSGLYSPFYKSNLDFELKVDQVSKIVNLNLKGDLLLISECQAPYIDALLAQSILEFYPDFKYQISLNGSKDNYNQLIVPLEYYN